MSVPGMLSSPTKDVPPTPQSHSHITTVPLEAPTSLRPHPPAPQTQARKPAEAATAAPPPQPTPPAHPPTPPPPPIHHPQNSLLVAPFPPQQPRHQQRPHQPSPVSHPTAPSTRKRSVATTARNSRRTTASRRTSSIRGMWPWAVGAVGATSSFGRGIGIVLVLAGRVG